MKVLVTGGAGFIGSAVVRRLAGSGVAVVNLDKLTYAGNLESVAAVASSPLYAFERADVCDAAAVAAAFEKHQPDAVIHLAAETHVDRSIDGPAAFIRTNVLGTSVLLAAALGYWGGLPQERKDAFRLLHVSSDEVYGDLGPQDPAFTEDRPYAPSSPYAASKAASDHLVRAWGRTYGLPTLVSKCSNNYGPWQFPEKLIPLAVLNAIEGRPIAVYGDGEQVRDWLHVDDHAAALELVLTKGRVGETYNIGGRAERRNIDVVRALCAILEELRPERPPGISHYEDLIAFVADRPGHDRRYAMDTGKIGRELGWAPEHGFEAALRATVEWQLANLQMLRGLRGRYDGRRLGLGQS